MFQAITFLARNAPSWQQNITQNRKSFITQSKLALVKLEDVGSVQLF